MIMFYFFARSVFVEFRLKVQKFIATSIHKNNETNDKFYRKVAFLMYTEMVDFIYLFLFTLYLLLTKIYKFNIRIKISAIIKNTKK